MNVRVDAVNQLRGERQGRSVRGTVSRVGADVVSIHDVEASISQFGARYLDRVYTALEQTQTKSVVERVAARFAGKEAVLKVLRPTPLDSTPLRDIEIALLPSGAPHVRLKGHARSLAATQRLERLTLSLSHHSDTAFAVAIGEFTAPDAEKSVERVVRRAVERHAGLRRSIGSVHPDRNLHDIGLTPRAGAVIFLVLEDELHIEIPDEAFPRGAFLSIASIVSIVRSAVETKRPSERCS